LHRKHPAVAGVKANRPAELLNIIAKQKKMSIPSIVQHTQTDGFFQANELRFMRVTA